MEVTLLIIFGAIVVIVALFIFFRRRMPRMQHYAFAHEVLPSRLFANPESVIIPLIAPQSFSPGGRELLLALWNEAAEASTDPTLLSPDGLDYTSDVFDHPNSTACLIRLPQPLKKPEAYFAAIVFDGPGLAAGSPRQLRYFVLEHHGEKDGQPQTLVGEWSADARGKLKYSDHEFGTPPTVESFVGRVRTIIETSGSMPEPVAA